MAFPSGAIGPKRAEGPQEDLLSDRRVSQPTPETHSSYRPINEAFRFITKKKTDASPGAEEG